MSKRSLSFIALFLVGVTIYSLNSTLKRMHIVKQAAVHTSEKDSLKDGDLIFQVNTAGQGLAIQLATKSRFTHVGVIFRSDNEWKVYEAVEPVQCIPLDEFIERGDSAYYVIKRLKNRDSLFKGGSEAMMKSYLEMQLDKHYDPYFSWQDNSMYCSELVWKAYKKCGIEISGLRLLSSFDLSSPTVKKILKERYGNKIPLKETVVSPADIYDSDRLELVTAGSSE